jgi:hypothetical protein
MADSFYTIFITAVSDAVTLAYGVLSLPLKRFQDFLPNRMGGSMRFLCHASLEHNHICSLGVALEFAVNEKNMVINGMRYVKTV